MDIKLAQSVTLDTAGAGASVMRSGIEATEASWPSNTRLPVPSFTVTLDVVYRANPEGERRYGPAEIVSTEVVPICGDPDPERFALVE